MRRCSSSSSARFGVAGRRGRGRPRSLTSCCAPPASAARPRRSARVRRPPRSPRAPTRTRSRSSLRDPARRGPLIARVLESYGVGVALEAELPVASTGVGGALLALLEAEHGTARAADVLRWLRGPVRGRGRDAVDWFERRIRRERAQTASRGARALGARAPTSSPTTCEACARPGPPASPRRSARRRRGWRCASSTATRTGRRRGRATGPSCRRPPRSRRRWPRSAELGGLAPGAVRADRAAARPPLPRLDRADRGPGADRRPAAPAGGPLRPRRDRLAAGRRVPAPRRRRPVPLRRRSATRWASTPAATTTPRSATSSTRSLGSPAAA